MKNNSLVKKEMSFSDFLTGANTKKVITNRIGENQYQQFVSSITSAVGLNPDLKECDYSSLLTAALQGQALKLNPSPQIGQFYMVPYRVDGKKTVQFQIGYKGYIQLAIRTNQYRKINVVEIKDGELISYDNINEELKANIIEDDDERAKAQTIGYYAMFELINGFRKSIYWSKKKMEKHANKYSQAFRAKRGKSFWEKDFDEMAKKTMIRQLISKWGVLSIEMETAIKSDMAEIQEDGEYNYIDNSADDLKEETIIVETVEVAPEDAEKIDLSELE